MQFQEVRVALSCSHRALLMISFISSDHLPSTASLPGSQGTQRLLQLEFVPAC